MSVPICNRFNTSRANNGKITSFQWYSFLTPSFEGNPLTQRLEISSGKTSHRGSQQWRFRDPSLHRFDKVQGCDVHQINFTVCNRPLVAVWDMELALHYATLLHSFLVGSKTWLTLSPVVKFRESKIVNSLLRKTTVSCSLQLYLSPTPYRICCRLT